MNNYLIKTAVLLALFLTACGGPTEEEISATTTQVAADLFATQTANAPTATPTPTNTPIPTPTNTPEPTPSNAPDESNGSSSFDNPYFPLVENFTWWYMNVDSDGNLDFSNFSLWFIDETDDGVVYYTFITQDATLDNVLDIYLSDKDGFGIAYTATYYTDGSYNESEISPVLPIMILPIEDGDSWEMETTIGDSPILMGFRATYFPTLEFEANTFEECYAITYLEDGANGNPIFIEYYCLDLGKVGFEYNDGSEWIPYELLFFTTGRISWDEFITENDTCKFTFSIHGFDPGETYGLVFYQVPNFNEPINEWADFSADIPLEFTFSSDLPNGTYFLDFTGSEGNSASFIANWNGSCPE